MVAMIIYKTTNLINNKIYIGKDSRNKINYLGSGKILKLSIEKYGRENFIKETIEICHTQKELCEREKYWIEWYKNKEYKLYNIAEGGSGGKTTPVPWNKGKKLAPLSEDHKEKISKALMGHIQAEETKIKIGEGLKNQPKSEEHKDKLSKANKGKKISQETKIKMSIARKDIPQKKIQCPHCKKCGGITMYRWHFDNCKLLFT